MFSFRLGAKKKVNLNILTFVERERFEKSPVGSLVEITGTDGRFNAEYRHVAFVPEPLSEEPQLSAETWHEVANARAALARLDQASRQVENPRMLRRPTLSREAQSTSALEGTFAPLEQVMAADTVHSRSKELQEVINYMVAAENAFDQVMERRRLSVGLFEGAHQQLVVDTEADTDQAGQIRTIQVAIGSPTGALEDARFVPMPPGVQLNVAVRDLIDWIHDDSRSRDPIVAAALAHYQFETLHPFNDGNGRIGRLLIVLHLMVSETISQPLLSVSPWFEARRNSYQDLLADVSATGNWDGWIRFFARGVAASAEDVAARVDRLLAIHQRYVELLRKAGARGVIRDIVDELISSPVVTIPRLAATFKKASPTMRTAVNKLVELGILSEPIGQYGRQFVSEDVMQAVLASPDNVLPPEAPLHFERARSV